MRIASVAKAFSGAVALALVERGVLSLDETIGELLPDFNPDWDGVTLRQLLRHTSGVPDFTASAAFQERVNAHFDGTRSVVVSANEQMSAGLKPEIMARLSRANELAVCEALADES